MHQFYVYIVATKKWNFMYQNAIYNNIILHGRSGINVTNLSKTSTWKQYNIVERN